MSAARPAGENKRVGVGSWRYFRGRYFRSHGNEVWLACDRIEEAAEEGRALTLEGPIGGRGFRFTKPATDPRDVGKEGAAMPTDIDVDVAGGVQDAVERTGREEADMGIGPGTCNRVRVSEGIPAAGNQIQPAPPIGDIRRGDEQQAVWL